MADKPRVTLFVANRDITVVSLHGHSVEFKQGVKTEAPTIMTRELIEKGIMPVDQADTDKAVADPEAAKQPPEDGEDRAAAIVKAMAAIIKRNVPADFAGSAPSAEAISRLVGWPVDRKEARKVWETNRSELLPK